MAIKYGAGGPQSYTVDLNNKKNDNNLVISTINSMNHLTNDFIGGVTVVDKLRFLFNVFCIDSNIDFVKLSQVLNYGFQPLFTGSRAVEDGYTEKSDIDIVVAVKHSYCKYLTGGINITKDSDEVIDSDGDKFYEDINLGDGNALVEQVSPVSTFRFGPINLILVHPEAYSKWKLATQVAVALKLTQKRERVMVFQAIRHNRFMDIHYPNVAMPLSGSKKHTSNTQQINDTVIFDSY